MFAANFTVSGAEVVFSTFSEVKKYIQTYNGHGYIYTNGYRIAEFWNDENSLFLKATNDIKQPDGPANKAGFRAAFSTVEALEESGEILSMFAVR